MIPRVGDNKSLDLERIVAMKPDLIVVWRHGNAMQQLDRLRDLHVPMFFSEPRKLEDIATTLDKLGHLLGTEKQANAASGAFRQDVAALRTRYEDRPPVSVFYQVWSDPLMTLNGEQIISEVIRLCGGKNVFADLKPLVPTVSTEAVLRRESRSDRDCDARRDAFGTRVAIARCMAQMAFHDGGGTRESIGYRR